MLVGIQKYFTHTYGFLKKPPTSLWLKELKLQEIEWGEKLKFESDDIYDEGNYDFFEDDCHHIQRSHLHPHPHKNRHQSKISLSRFP